MSGAAMTRSLPGLWLCSTESLALAGGGGVRGPGVRQSSGESLCPHHGQGEARGTGTHVLLAWGWQGRKCNPARGRAANSWSNVTTTTSRLTHHHHYTHQRGSPGRELCNERITPTFLLSHKFLSRTCSSHETVLPFCMASSSQLLEKVHSI